MSGEWEPSIVVASANGWHASRDPSQLAVGSWFMAELLFPREAEAVERFARGALLDLGCGKAPLYGVYRPLAETVHRVDWPGSAHGSRYIDQFVDLNQPLELPKGAFDTVLSTSVLEH